MDSTNKPDKPIEERAFWTDVKNCARCGGDHENVLFMTLANHEKYTHFGMCPDRRQPILMIAKED